MIRLPLDAPVCATQAPQHTAAPAAAALDVGTAAAISPDARPPSGSGHDESPSHFLTDRLKHDAMRMAPQLRREFDHVLDVGHFLRDAGYAREVITLALASRDARLRAYATFLEMQMFSARHGAGVARLRQPQSQLEPSGDNA